MFNNKLTTVLLAALVTLASSCTITDITSTTSSTLDAVTPDVTLNRFIDVRFASIQKEAAAGEGENLEALAHLMGKKDKAAFSGWIQANYEALFTGLEQPTQLISRIEKISAQQQI